MNKIALVRSTIAGSAMAAVVAGSLGASAPASAATGPADLKVSITESAPTVGTNDLYNYTFTVQNVGGTGAAPVRLKVNLDEATVVSFTRQDRDFACIADAGSGGHRFTCNQGFMPEQSSAVIIARVRAPQNPATVTVTAQVDPNNTIAESNENNNTDSESTNVVARPDLDPAVLSGTDAVNGSFTPLSFRVKVENKGQGAVSNARFDLRFDDNDPVNFKSLDFIGSAKGFSCDFIDGFFDTKQVVCTGGDLDAGESVTLDIRAETGLLLPFTSGQGRLRVIADPANTRIESNENNNTASHHFSWES